MILICFKGGEKRKKTEIVEIWLFWIRKSRKKKSPIGSEPEIAIERSSNQKQRHRKEGELWRSGGRLEGYEWKMRIGKEPKEDLTYVIFFVYFIVSLWSFASNHQLVSPAFQGDVWKTVFPNFEKRNRSYQSICTDRCFLFIYIFVFFP